MLRGNVLWNSKYQYVIVWYYCICIHRMLEDRCIESVSKFEFVMLFSFNFIIWRVFHPSKEWFIIKWIVCVFFFFFGSSASLQFNYLRSVDTCSGDCNISKVFPIKCDVSRPNRQCVIFSIFLPSLTRSCDLLTPFFPSNRIFLFVLFKLSSRFVWLMIAVQ